MRTMTMLLACALALPAGAKVPPRKTPPKAVAARPAPTKPAPPVVIAPLPETPEIAHLRKAFEFGLPVYEMMRTRYAQVSKAEAAGAPGLNHLYPRLKLADAASREVTTPNNDTLYSSAWLDLAGGPVILDVPMIPNRYASVHLMNLYTDADAVFAAAKGGRFLIVGPDWKGKAPKDTKLVRASTNDAWLLVRVLVDGPDDLAAASGLIRGFTLEVPADNAPLVPITAPATPNPNGTTFRAVVNEAIGRSPLPKRGRDFADVGILPLTPENAGSAPDLPKEVAALWTASLPALMAELKGGLAASSTIVDGWSYPGRDIGDYGDDDAARARTALGGLGALPASEAIYLTATTDEDGQPLTGAKAYTVHIPPKLPIGAFWSLTMYQPDKDGRLFFVDTPSKRFAVGDRTPDLHAERDGGLDIFVQTGRPSGERVVNWLPAPAGPFRLVFRAYLPKGEIRLPPVEATEVVP